MLGKKFNLEELSYNTEFIDRHIGPDERDQQKMLRQLGLKSNAELMQKVIPESIYSTQPLALGDSCTEQDALRELKAIAAGNKVYRSFIGQGYYDCYTPNVILRNLLENPGWYTAYTPYQPEISQGRLEALLNFQTMVSDLTGMDIANASMLDEATAAAEAMALCRRVSKSKSNVFFVSSDSFPQTIAVIRTRAKSIGIEVVVGEPETDLTGLDCFAAILQYPTANGEIHDYHNVITEAKQRNVMMIMAADLLSLMLLKSPGALGADIAVGSSQRFGVPFGFGGPHAAYMACKDPYKRALPGRIVGVSIDSHGDTAYRLALQTREQHIRRENATSNICTAQVLLAVIAGMYAAYHGPEGLQRIARRVHYLTTVLANGLKRLGYQSGEQPFFDTLTVKTGENTESIHERAYAQQINLREIDDQHIGISLDETSGAGDVASLWQIFAGEKQMELIFEDVETDTNVLIPAGLLRTDQVLQHPVFNSYHSETEMMRYLRKLADKDIALDRAMIPLGSCTMKLNASAEMIPITWPEFNRIHPFAPLEQAQGYMQLITELEEMLCKATGYDAVSLQPNAGSQGEYSGLLAIKSYHESRDDYERNICLIPSSAHGTNPATANMCGMKVVVVKSDTQGNVDIDDLTAKAEQHSKHLAAIMVTYPSTHGVFEEQITDVCRIVHEHGGQVYMDGANMNAMIAYCYPGKFGGDVSHLNLHKTFCIPHGGGGPGVGPIAVAEHLAPFLPGHEILTKINKQTGTGPVAAAPWGSAGILPISWMYIKMMGHDGLKQATEVAILNANYIASRLKDHYPILYTGASDMVAHECIIDLRHFKDSSGVIVDDVAKRLIDFGFHAPTMSFPVPGTLMIEPTESECPAELDRFCEAMITIREEIRAIEEGKMDREDNLLKNAPHTAETLTADDWQHGYPREQAAYPVKSLRSDKYWSPVGRVDNVYGDRNLVCACPPVSAYEEQGL